MRCGADGGVRCGGRGCRCMGAYGSWWSWPSLAFIVPAVWLGLFSLVAGAATIEWNPGGPRLLSAAAFAGFSIPWAPQDGSHRSWGWGFTAGQTPQAGLQGAIVAVAASTVAYHAPLMTVAVAGFLLDHWPLYVLAPYLLVLALNGWLIHAGLVRHRRALNPFVGLFTSTTRRKARRSRAFRFLGTLRKTA